MFYDVGHPAIRELKMTTLQTKPLIRFLWHFLENFQIEDMGHGNFTIELVSVDTSDVLSVEACIDEFVTSIDRMWMAEFKEHDALQQHTPGPRPPATPPPSHLFSHSKELRPPKERT